MTAQSTTDTAIRVELHLRGDTYSDFGAREVIERVKRLGDDDAFGEWSVAGVWHRVQSRAGDWNSTTMETYEEFLEWAETNGFSLEPGFQRRTRSFVGMDGAEEIVVFPTVALALYDGDVLGAVFPCTDEARTYTVERALEAVERGEEEWLGRFDRSATEDAGGRPIHGDLSAD